MSPGNMPSTTDIASMAVFQVIPIQYSGKDFLINEISADTIFRLSDNKNLSPIAVRTPSVAKSNELIFLTAVGETPRYLFMGVLDFNKEFEDAYRYLIHDKREDKVYSSALYNDDYTTKKLLDFSFSGSAFNVNITPVGSIYKMIDAFELVQMNKEGELRGPLKEIADQLKEDDNPVLMIATFKE